MGLSRISNELQFGKPQASPHMTREGSAFIEGNRKLEGGQRKQRVAGFSLAESLPGKESFLFLLGSALIVRHESFPF